MADWLVLSVILFSYVARDVILWRNIKAILLVGVVSALSVFLVSILPSCAVFFYLVMLIPGLVYLGQLNADNYYPSFVIVFLSLLAANMPQTITDSMYIALAMLIGTAINLLWQLKYLPVFKYWHARRYTVSAVKNLQAVWNDLFVCLMEPDYAEAVYLFERRLHTNKNQFLSEMTLLQTILKSYPHSSERNDWFYTMNEKLSESFALMLEMSTVRWRALDQNVFALCRPELLQVNKALFDMFQSLVRLVRSQNGSMDDGDLQRKIQALEENYQNVMQVTAPDPLVLLLFIDSLKLFCDKLCEVKGLT